MTGQRASVSVVVPVYRSQDCLPLLLAELSKAFEASGRTHEIVLVNDGSPDRSWEVIAELSRRYPEIRGIDLRRNFGQDGALMAGLQAATGAAVVIMDDDLQHAPRDIEKLVAKVEEGFDVCYARFVSKQQSWWKNFGSWLNGKLAEHVIGKPPEIYLSPFKAISAEVVREVVKYEGPYPYVDGLIFLVTDNITQVDAEHYQRAAGATNYTLIKSVRVWLRLATCFSVVPLRIATILGLVFSLGGFLLALLFSVMTIMGVSAPTGWASTVVTVLVLGGIQLATMGIMGEYLGRLYLTANRKPQYVVRETVGGKRA